jgi:hypothetical protein
MSKYRNKKKDVKPAPKRKLDAPVFNYNCQCHDIKASKKPCVVDTATQFSDRNKLEHSLGTWTCAISRKACKVNRTRNKVEEPETEQAAA